MADSDQTPRRTVLQTLAALGGIAIGGAAPVTATGTGTASGTETASGTGTATATATTASLSARSNDDYDGNNDDRANDAPVETERYVAVVDRIVDGEHVVLLLEEDGQIVDELVVPRSAFDTVEESDILAVIVADDELVDYRILPERPCDTGETEPATVDEIRSAADLNSSDDASAEHEFDCL